MILDTSLNFQTLFTKKSFVICVVPTVAESAFAIVAWVYGTIEYVIKLIGT